MRLVRCVHDGIARVGVVISDGREVAVSREWTDITHRFGGESLTAATESTIADPLAVVQFEGLALLAPITPTSIRDFMTFEQHLLPIVQRQGGTALPARPATHPHRRPPATPRARGRMTPLTFWRLPVTSTSNSRSARS